MFTYFKMSGKINHMPFFGEDSVCMYTEIYLHLCKKLPDFT